MAERGPRRSVRAAVQLSAESVDRLVSHYPTAVSCAVVGCTVLYGGVLLGAIMAEAFTIETNVPELLSDGQANSTELRLIGSYALFHTIGVCWEWGAITSAILLTTFSLVWPGLLLVVWFVPLTLRVRSRIVRWLSRLSSLMLTFFFYILFLVGFLQLSYEDKSGVFREIVSQPGPAVYMLVFVVVLVLVLVEWVFVLHYNATFWAARMLRVEAGIEAKEHDGKGFYFGRSLCCNTICCVKELQDAHQRAGDNEQDALRKGRRSITRSMALREGWHMTPDRKKSKGGPVLRTIATDMVFLRGRYKYACSSIGLCWLGIWSLAILCCGALSLTLPVVQTSVSVPTAPGATQISYVTLADIILAPLELESSGGVVLLITVAFTLIVVVVVLLHVIVCVSMFLPLERLCGKGFLRLLCHAGNVLSPFASFDVAIMAVLMLVVDFTHLVAGMLGKSVAEHEDFGSAVCFEVLVDNVELCVALRTQAGLYFALAAILLNYPHVYYFAETYHRHFGLVADGRSEQSYRSGETTHKHRAEGCMVLACYWGCCCSRGEYTFRQESVDEEQYYGPDEQVANFFIPDKLLTGVTRRLSQAISRARSPSAGAPPTRMRHSHSDSHAPDAKAAVCDPIQTSRCSSVPSGLELVGVAMDEPYSAPDRAGPVLRPPPTTDPFLVHDAQVSDDARIITEFATAVVEEIASEVARREGSSGGGGGGGSGSGNVALALQ